MCDMLTAWHKEVVKYLNGEISKEEYDRRRYTYPKIGVQHTKEALDELCRKESKNNE